ncbi:MAG: peroxisome- protein [Candelina submexicana]|nr:MAG: peroxisome- protein [Candelina submexicana]
MSSQSPPNSEHGASPNNQDPNPPTIAPFSPNTNVQSPSSTRQRFTILVHQKSPLLVATPPQITRALAYSHPFILPLNNLAGLLSWTSGDPWESFLLVAGFWAIVLYGDVVMRWAGPVALVVGLILGMYSRRYSPLSSAGWTGEKQAKGHKRDVSEGSMKHHKSLDEIVETLKVFTGRCNVLLDPLLRLTDFLSTQRTATSATTRPALTTLFIRILLVTPAWIVLALPFVHIITTKRVVLTLGTLLLSWHSRPARVSREILWRSLTVRRICSTITGLSFSGIEKTPPPLPKRDAPPPLPPRTKSSSVAAEALSSKRRPDSSGVRFTFILYENQRRWLGIGWTYSMFAYERAAWTDEHLNAAPSKDQFELPEVEGGAARWRWVEGSEWRVEGAIEGEEGGPPGSEGKKRGAGGGGWIYYDNKWQDGKRGQDSWGRYTRRRKWYRDAELVEVSSSLEITPSASPHPTTHPDATLSETDAAPDDKPPVYGKDIKDDDSSSVMKRKWFQKKGKASSGSSVEVGDDRHDTIHKDYERDDEGWGVGDDARMGLG